MTEDAELQAKIAALTGRINQRRQQQQDPFMPPPRFQQTRQHVPNAHIARGRWSPYGRGGRTGYTSPYKNHTLVLGGGNQNSPPAASGTTASHSEALTDAPVPAAAFVSTRDPGKKQLMNKNTYEREQKQKLEHKTNARVAKRQKIDREERTQLMHHVNAAPASDNRELVVDGLRFQLRNDGSKLIRIHDPSTTTKETPKKVSIADVNFFRTKNGNLVRANALRGLLRYYPHATDALGRQDLLRHQYRPTNRKKTSQCEHFTKHGTHLPFQLIAWPRTKHHVRGKNPRFSADTSLGKCPFGPSCKFSHDPDKVAICKDFLRTGKCVAGDSCDLSHVTSYHRVPACTHFLRGNCTKEACPYPHVHVSSSAPVCRSFASLGFCSHGEDCTKRHVFECPDYSNTGFCANRESGKCQLPHPDRASILRKAAARQAKTGSEHESDLSSNEENQEDSMGHDDIDSDEAEDIIMGGVDQDHALTQQQDFIAFS